MFTIAFSSFKEVLRKKILYFVMAVTFLYLVLFGVLMYFAMSSLREGGVDGFNLIANSAVFVSIPGFYFSGMLVAFLSVMVGVPCISSEMENGTILAIITRPLKRWEYVLGKYLGTAGLLLAYSAFLYIAVILICLVMDVPLIGTLGFIPVLKGALFFMLEPLAILSLAVFGSVAFKTVANGVLVIAIYILGLIGSMMEQIGSVLDNGNLITFGILSSLISPFDVIYKQMMGAIYSNLGVAATLFGGPGGMEGNTPSQWMNLYIGVYVVGFLLLAMRIFSKKDIS